MVPVGVALSGFAVTLVVHVGWWRIALPDNRLRALILILLSGLFCVVVVVISATENTAAGLYALCLFGAASVCYLLTYTAIDSDSPTLTLVREMMRREDKSMTAGEIDAFIAARPFVRSRIDQMLQDGLLRREGDVLVLTGASLTALALFDCYRALIDRQTLGG